MKFRFRKTKKILPGIKVTLTNRGVGANVGGRHANIGVGKRGVSANASVPGSGISGRQKLSDRSSVVPFLLAFVALVGIGLLVFLIVVIVIF
jgi:hypothetical protein